MSLQITEESCRLLKIASDRIREVHKEVLLETAQLLKTYEEITHFPPNTSIHQEIKMFINHLEDSDSQKQEQRMVKKLQHNYKTIARFIEAELHWKKSE